MPAGADTVRVDPAKLGALLEACFRGVGVSQEDAAAVAEVLLDANLRGIDSHGVERAPVYMRRIRAKLAFGTQHTRVVAEDGPLARLDAGRALGPAVAVKATDLAIALAGRHGVGVVAVGGSSHFGHAGYYARRAAQSELVAIVTSNAAHSMAPQGSAVQFLGANPLAVGVPLGERGNFVLDMSTSVIARGSVRRAHAAGETLAPGLAIDARGEPTTDPAAALAGSMLPLAGGKGTGIALALCLLSATLAGADFDDEISSMYAASDATVAPSIGHVFLVLDPWRLSDRASTLARLEAFVDRLHGLPPIDPREPVRYAGERGDTVLAESMRDGVAVRTAELDALARACEESDLGALAERTRALAADPRSAPAADTASPSPRER